MDLATTPLPLGWVVASFVVAGAVLVWAARMAPWRRFASSEAVHVWYGTIFALVVLWSLRAVLDAVIVIHLLGIAGFALSAGGPLALVGGALVVAISTLMTGMLVTLAVVYRPDWVATFDDARYLHGK